MTWTAWTPWGCGDHADPTGDLMTMATRCPGNRMDDPMCLATIPSMTPHAPRTPSATTSSPKRLDAPDDPMSSGGLNTTGALTRRPHTQARVQPACAFAQGRERRRERRPCLRHRAPPVLSPAPPSAACAHAPSTARSQERLRACLRLAMLSTARETPHMRPRLRKMHQNQNGPC